MTLLFSKAGSTAGTMLTLRPFTGPNSPPGELFVLTGSLGEGGVTIRPAPGCLLPSRDHSRPLRLKLLHINDLHGQLVRFAGEGTRPNLAHIAGYVSHLRAQSAGEPGRRLLFVSAGDELGGSLFDDFITGEGIHAAYRLLTAAGLQVAVPGNHDFDFGAAALLQAIRSEAGFPLLAANLVSPLLQEAIFPAAIAAVDGWRIGLIGLTTPAQRPPGLDQEVRITHPLRAVEQLLPALRPLCDAVVIVSHLGYSLNSGTAATAIAGDLELAHALPAGQVQLIVGGHTHHAINEDGLAAENIANGIPIVQAGMFGRFLGEVTLTGNGRVAVSDARLQPTTDLPLDETFEREMVAPLVRQLQPAMRRPCGPPTPPPPSFGTEAVRNSWSAAESPLANLLTDGVATSLRLADQPVDFVLLDRSVVQRGLPLERPPRIEDWVRLMPYADTVRLASLNGYQLHQLLQDNARRASRPGEPDTERGFLHFSRSIRYRIEPGRERSRARAVQITVHGIPLELQMDQLFVAAFPSYVRRLALPWENQGGEKLNLVDIGRWPSRDTGLFWRKVCLQYLDGRRHLPDVDGRLRFEDGRALPPVPRTIPAVPLRPQAGLSALDLGET